jgi:Phage derived protein Gp49-like (DUF891)
LTKKDCLKVILLHGFTKKTDKTQKREIDIAVKRMQKVMHGKLKDFKKLRDQWLKDPEVRKEYDALKGEFQLA